MAEQVLFGAGDYAVFGVMLAVSLAIGIYYGIVDRKSKSVQTYLMGGREMNFWAVGMSLSFTFISAVTIIGIPSEIYIFGSMYIWLIFCLPIPFFIVNEIYIPLYFRLNITSSYEYLQLRFNYAVRVLGTLAYIAQTVLYIGVMIYAPSLAFSQVSGFNLWAAIFITGIVCTIYTTLGGLKAVIWTDVFQGIVVTIIMIVVMFMSANSVGGWNEVWLANSRTKRFEFFNFDLDPRVRHSVWSVVIGLGILWTSIFASTQSQVQRYLACSSIANAKKAMLFAMIISVVVLLMCCGTGWVMYAYFQNCDPIFSGQQATAPDQLLPLMVMRLFKDYPGLSGAFMAAVYAGCLSTVSSGINAMACVTSEDFIRPFAKWSESTMTIVAKVLVFVYGIVCIGFACLSTILGNVLQTSLTLLGIVGGPTLGMYTLGALFPFANSWGAISGFFVGLAMISWIYGGSREYKVPFKFLNLKSRTVAGCIAPPEVTEMIVNGTMMSTAEPFTTIFSILSTTDGFNNSTITMDALNFTTIFSILSTTDGFNNSTITMDALTTVSPAAPPERPPIAEFYAVSYAYYAAIGMGATLVSGLIISLLTCGHRRAKELDPLVVIPIFDHKMFVYCLPKKIRRVLWCGIDRDRPMREPSIVPIPSIDKRLANGEENPAFEMREIYDKV